MLKAQLYLIGVPIGNPEDLTLRASQILNSTDLWIGESRQGLAELKQMCGRADPATFCLLDRGTSAAEVEQLVAQIAQAGQALLVSDAGMPAIADPGVKLTRACLASDIQLIPIPGVSSILAALVLSGFDLHHWFYAGFLPREKADRRAAIEALNSEPLTTVLMETPYRLLPILEDLARWLHPSRRLALCWQLTCSDETVLRGNAEEILALVQELGWTKGEFVLVLDTL